MNDTVLIALIVAAFPMLSSVALAFIAGRQRRAERREEHERQDEIKSRTAALAHGNAVLRSLAEEHIQQTNAFGNRADAERRRIVEKLNGADEERGRIVEQLNAVYSMVNGNLTAAIQAQLTSKAAAIPLLQELIELRAGGDKVLLDDLKMKLTETKDQVASLQSILDERIANIARAKKNEAP